jgi:hypothetical protein
LRFRERKWVTFGERPRLEELLLQQRRALVETQAQLPRSVENRVQQTAASIRRDGRGVADLIHGGSDPKEIDAKLQDAQARVQERTNELARVAQETVEQHMEALSERVKQITESELAKELLPRLVARLEVELGDLDVDPEKLAKARKVSDVTRQLGQFLVKNSFKGTATTFAGIFKLYPPVRPSLGNDSSRHTDTSGGEPASIASIGINAGRAKSSSWSHFSS